MGASSGLQGNGLIDGTELTLSFGPEPGSRQISGSDGCNGFSGMYVVDGDMLVFDAVISTALACSEPNGVMEQASVYLDILRNATRWSWQGRMLTLFTPDGRALAYEATP